MSQTANQAANQTTPKTMTQTTTEAMNAGHWLVILLTATMFGSSFLFINVAVEAIPPMTLAAGRAALALPIAWGFLALAGGRLPPLGAGWRPLVVLGILTAVIPYSTIAWGQLHIESGLAGILFGTIPVISVALAPLIARDETYTASRIVGAAIGLLGVVLVIGPQVLAGFGDQLLGALVTLGAAFSYALGVIYARTRPDITPPVMVAGQLVVGSLVLVALSLAVDAPWGLAPSTEAVTAVAIVAVVSTAAPTLLLFWLIRRVGATNGSLMTFFMPVVAVALGAALLGEALPWQAFAGLGLILLGAAAVNGRIGLGPLRKALGGSPAGHLHRTSTPNT